MVGCLYLSIVGLQLTCGQSIMISLSSSSSFPPVRRRLSNSLLCMQLQSSYRNFSPTRVLKNCTHTTFRECNNSPETFFKTGKSSPLSIHFINEDTKINVVQAYWLLTQQLQYIQIHFDERDPVVWYSKAFSGAT